MSLQARFDRLENLFLAFQRGGASVSPTGEAPPPARRDRGAVGGGHADFDDRGGGGRHGTGGRASGGPRGGRPGDWACLQCGAQPCFARTARCYRCGAPRNGALAFGSSRPGRGGNRADGIAGPASQSTYLGPVGAGGSRPLLGRRADTGPRSQRSQGDAPTSRADASPTVRVPNASVAARAAAQTTDGAARNGQRPPPTRIDAEGFQEVQSRGTSRSWAAVAAAAPAARGEAPAVGVNNSWQALDDAMDTSEGGPARHDETNGDGDHANDADDARRADRADDDGDDADPSNGGAGRGDAGTEADADQLRQIWDERCAAVRRLERDPQGFPPELLEAARAQRDAAEQEWRSARRPHPLHKRLRWAEADLRDAEAKEKAHRNELEIHLEQAERRTRELRERLQVDEARTTRKRQALAALQREGSQHQSHGSERAARIAIEGLGADIVPALGAIIRQLGEADEPVRRDLQIVAQSLGRVEGILRSGTEHDLASRGPACFNIAEDDTGGAKEVGGRDGDGKSRENSGGSASTAGTECPHSVAKGTRWTKPTESAPWRKEMELTSAEAVEEARRRVRPRTQGDQAAGQHDGGVPAGEHREQGALAENLHGAGTDPSCTNDLAEAARRAQAAAHLQIQQVHLRQQTLADPQHQREEEALRQQRAQNQQEELLRHQAVFQQAAAARAADEERRRAELLASLTPEELARAAELHARNEAIGTQVFGTPAASHLAGLVQAQGQQQAQQQSTLTSEGNADATARTEVDDLMAMSAEEYAAWNGQHHGL